MENLDPQYLQVKKDEISKNFTELQGEVKKIEVQEAALAQNKSAINLEMLRLQGEHRLLEELMGGDKPAEPAAPTETVTP